MQYRYFVSYSHEKGHGNMELVRNKKIAEYEDIRAAQEYVMEKYPEAGGVVIMNFILLDDK